MLRALFEEKTEGLDSVTLSCIAQNGQVGMSQLSMTDIVGLLSRHRLTMDVQVCLACRSNDVRKCGVPGVANTKDPGDDESDEEDEDLIALMIANPIGAICKLKSKC